MKKISHIIVFSLSVVFVFLVIACQSIDDMIYLELKGKSFQMGAEYSGSYDWEKPVHKVTFTHDIYICDHEVTQAEWEAVWGTNPSFFQGDEDSKVVAASENQANRPVEWMTWYEAVAFCNELTKIQGIEQINSSGAIDYVYFTDMSHKTPYTKDDASSNKEPYMKIEATGYRLPTEAEWEYAARGGETATDKAVWAGTSDENKLGDYAWYYDNSDDKTHEVKTKKPNGYGLYDMSGNVWELCWDWYGNYQAEDQISPVGASSGSERVMRGGGHRGTSGVCVALRYYLSPTRRASASGFRVVRTCVER